jgi:hypothetical protein
LKQRCVKPLKEKMPQPGSAGPILAHQCLVLMRSRNAELDVRAKPKRPEQRTRDEEIQLVLCFDETRERSGKR